MAEDCAGHVGLGDDLPPFARLRLMELLRSTRSFRCCRSFRVSSRSIRKLSGSARRKNVLRQAVAWRRNGTPDHERESIFAKGSVIVMTVEGS